MGMVNCLYCGEPMADDVERCPKCGSPSHYQKRGFRLGARTRLILLFMALSMASLIIAIWLPR